jgi:hypothetical protein
MPTIFRNPTGDASVVGTWTGTAGNRWTGVNDHPDEAGTTFITHGTTAGNLMFKTSGIAIPAGSTISGVRVIYYDFKNASQACTFGARIRVGTGYYNAATHNPGNGIANITLREDVWATNPRTGSGWTVDQVNGVGDNILAEFGYNSGADANPSISTSSIQLLVEYTDLPATITISYVNIVENNLNYSRYSTGNIDWSAVDLIFDFVPQTTFF